MESSSAKWERQKVVLKVLSTIRTGEPAGTRTQTAQSVEKAPHVPLQALESWGEPL